MTPHSEPESIDDFNVDTLDILPSDAITESSLFVYGTLTRPNHVKMLLGREVESLPATLYNYIRIAPTWSFPFIVPQPKTKTIGAVLKGLSDEELEELDKFEDEGNLYRRQRVRVKLKDGSKLNCYTYVGRVDRLQASFGKDVDFDDRFSVYLERKIVKLVEKLPTDRPDIHKRVLQELMGSAVDSIIDSVFDGDYLCNYIMIQTLRQSAPPRLRDVLANEALRPYAGNYMYFACQHIILNQFTERFRAQSPEVARNDTQYLRHGLALMMALTYYNMKKPQIESALDERRCRIVDGTRGYRDYAGIAIDVADETYNELDAATIIHNVDEEWYHAPTPLGAELEFSNLGAQAINAKPGEDPIYDGFYWFNDFDLLRRTWRLGGHVDAHKELINDKTHARGFLEYALGRYQIVGDLSRPLFVCPWAISRIINELVQFQTVAPHSLHVSMEIPKNGRFTATEQHEDENLICLLLLAGDLRLDKDGILREWRIWNQELAPNPGSPCVNFLSRKTHYNRPVHDGDDDGSAAEVMEFKFPRLFREETDYEAIVTGLKGYLFATNTRPITAKDPEFADIPEHAVLREWAANPQPLDPLAIDDFTNTVRSGLLIEYGSIRLDACIRAVLHRLDARLHERNEFVRTHAQK